LISYLDRVNLVQALRLDQLVGFGARKPGDDFEGESVILRLAVGSAMLLVRSDGCERGGAGDGLVSKAALMVVLNLIGGLLVVRALEASESGEMGVWSGSLFGRVRLHKVAANLAGLRQ